MIPERPDWNRLARIFDGSDESHRKQMWIARVVLFFKCNFRELGPQDKPIPCLLALVSRLRVFTAPDARKSPHPPYLACNWHRTVNDRRAKSERQHFCTSAIQLATFESSQLQTLSLGLAWPRAFWTACCNHEYHPDSPHSSPARGFAEAAFRRRKGSQRHACRGRE